MSTLSDTFIQALPDLTLVVRRDGMILSNLGGRELEIPSAPGSLQGKTIGELWSADAAAELTRMVRVALKVRKQVEGRLLLGEQRVEARVRPQGIDRCFAVLRLLSRAAATRADEAPGGATPTDPHDCAAFAREFCAAIDSARLRETSVGLLLVSLDALPGIEQTYGSARRATVLGAAAERLSQFCSNSPAPGIGSLRPARIEGDLLAVLLDRVGHAKAAQQAAARIKGLLERPLIVDGSKHRLSPAVGLAVYPGDGIEPDALLERARAALLEVEVAKDAPVENGVEAVGRVSGGDEELAIELRRALEREELAVEYSPIVELAGRRTTDYLSSLTWLHAISGKIDPESHAALLGSTDLRARLDLWTLRRVCKDLSSATRRGNTRMRVHLRLDHGTLANPSTVDEIQAAVKDAEIGISRLDIDIGAKSLTYDSASLETLRTLRNCGARVFLDNFGNVGIPLAKFGSLPLDGVKIARAIVGHCDTNPHARAACLSAAAMARAFGLACIAQGVERRAQLDVALESECSHASGRAFGPPGDAALLCSGNIAGP
jgi:predicted signal transduction protein with EAL and GGDEF domain